MGAKGEQACVNFGLRDLLQEYRGFEFLGNHFILNHGIIYLLVR